jgi:hypothetical protein
MVKRTRFTEHNRSGSPVLPDENAKPRTHPLDVPDETEKIRYSPLRYSVGIDYGQASDPTAVAVLERVVIPPQTAAVPPGGDGGLVEGEEAFDLIYLKRPPLGTSYDRIAERIVDLVLRLEPKGAFGEHGQLVLSTDSTGVGRAVTDILRKEFATRKLREGYMPRVDFRPCTITGSNTSPQPPSFRGDYYKIPKRDLVFPLVAAMQRGQVRLAKDLEAADKEQFLHELLHYRRKVNISTGNEAYESWRERDHDDELFATALALWGFEQRRGQRKLRVYR